MRSLRVSGGSHTLAISEPAALSPALPNDSCTTAACIANTTEAANFRDANFEGASADGSKVFFTSTQQLLDNATQDGAESDGAVPHYGKGGLGCAVTSSANGCNLYEYDFGNPGGRKLVLLSGGDSSGLGPNVQGVAGISEDGTHVYFVAKGVLTREPRGGGAGACVAELSAAELAEEEITKEGRCRPKKEADNLYVNDTTTGRTAFVATLSPADSDQWPFNRSRAIGGLTGPMNVTDDGGFLVFTSAAHLTAGDTGAVRQVFRYEAATGALVRVSVGNEGFDSNGNADVGAAFIETVGQSDREEAAGSVDPHPAVSEDGAIVVFRSSLALTAGALDNRCAEEEGGACLELALNMYEYRDGHVYLISDGRDTSAGGGTVSPSGKDIFFETNDSLVPQDADTLGDIYDARVEGGFPAATPAQCDGEGCRGAPGAPGAGAPAPGSAVFSGAGNLTAPLVVTEKPRKKAAPRCSKGRRAVHGRCVKAKRRKKARATKTTSDHRSVK
jgi:hypothetical protein